MTLDFHDSIFLYIFNTYLYSIAFVCGVVQYIYTPFLNFIV